MLKRLLIYTCTIVILTTSSCDPARRKVEDPLPTKTVKPTEFAFISNEGNFQFGNASLTMYDFANDRLIQDAFKAVNNRPLGDVLQSTFINENQLFLVLNNSQRIEVVDLPTQQLIRTINGFHSPRYILPKFGDMAYVSEYYANEIKLINLTSGIVDKRITIPGWHDEMIISDNKLFVTTTNRNMLYVINTTTDALEDSIRLRLGSHAIVKDKLGKLWTLCGGAHLNERAALYCINPTNNQVEKILELTNNDANKLVINHTKDMLYYINEHIYQLPISATVIPEKPFIMSNNNRFYGLGYNINRNELWAADAVDYVQRSAIIRYNSNGIQVGGFRAGINSGHFTFYKEQ
jgi:DNA-binding beta-propeller fold protein YncE